MSWLNLHRLAAARGDGLRPELQALFEHRAETIEANPSVVELNSVHPSGLVQAGPCPTPRVPDFLPGNVVPLASYARPARQAARKSSRP